MTAAYLILAAAMWAMSWLPAEEETAEALECKPVADIEGHAMAAR